MPEWLRTRYPGYREIATRWKDLVAVKAKQPAKQGICGGTNSTEKNIETFTRPKKNGLDGEKNGYGQVVFFCFQKKH